MKNIYRRGLLNDFCVEYSNGSRDWKYQVVLTADIYEAPKQNILRKINK